MFVCMYIIIYFFTKNTFFIISNLQLFIKRLLKILAHVTFLKTKTTNLIKQ
jgi:hypothetical protein